MTAQERRDAIQKQLAKLERDRDALLDTLVAQYGRNEDCSVVVRRLNGVYREIEDWEELEVSNRIRCEEVTAQRLTV